MRPMAAVTVWAWWSSSGRGRGFLAGRRGPGGERGLGSFLPLSRFGAHEGLRRELVVVMSSLKERLRERAARLVAAG